MVPRRLPNAERRRTRTSSSPAAASSSCVRGPSRFMASRRNRSSAAASRRSSKCVTAKPVLVRLPELNFNDDKADKPVGINQHIGRRPIAAFGNSVGDKEMLEYTQGGSGARLCCWYCTRCGREYAYGPARGLPRQRRCLHAGAHEHANKDRWTVVSMKDDWKQVFAFEQTPVRPLTSCWSRTHDAPAFRSPQGAAAVFRRTTWMRRTVRTSR